MSLSARNINKTFGRLQVLDNLSFDFPSGCILGLLGNNGAGKSTLINIMCDLIRPDSGEIIINGETFENNSLEIRSKMGVLPETGLLNTDLSGKEQLEFAALLYGIKPSDIGEQLDTMLNYFFDDLSLLSRRCGTYSTGMRKKLGLILAFLHKPTVALLDEPFSGLDPASARLVINFLKSYKREDRSILISSHNLSYVQQISTHIAVLHEGTFPFSGTHDDFTADGQNQLENSLFELIMPNEKDTNELKRVLA
ncbi:MAG: ABC transporter ATP-binding protein [Balneolia bacterium]|nr:ABC transporter ATP-binding protein [Balneolia bacterium]